MKRICLIKGESQYDTTRTFIDVLDGIFRAEGHQVFVVDMARDDWPGALAASFEQPLTFAFSFNAIGADVVTEGVSIYDRMGAPFVASLMDHPLYHLERIGSPVQRSVFCCVDRSHARFLHQHGRGNRTTAFLPHGGIEVPGSERPITARDHDLVFGGTFNDPEAIRAGWSSLPEGKKRILDDLADLIGHDPALPIDVALERVLMGHGLWAGDALVAHVLKLAARVDAYHRARRRLNCLEALARGGISLAVFGDNWRASSLASSPRVHLYEAVSYSSMLEVMTRSKFVLNVLPGFPDGSHDRIFCGMLNGAVSVTDSNGFLSEKFTDGRDILMFPTLEPEALPDRLAQLLSHQDELETIARNGQARCRNEHTWSTRGQTIARIAALLHDSNAS